MIPPLPFRKRKNRGNSTKGEISTMQNKVSCHKVKISNPRRNYHGTIFVNPIVSRTKCSVIFAFNFHSWNTRRKTIGLPHTGIELWCTLFGIWHISIQFNGHFCGNGLISIAHPNIHISCICAILCMQFQHASNRSIWTKKFAYFIKCWRCIRNGKFVTL